MTTFLCAATQEFADQDVLVAAGHEVDILESQVRRRLFLHDLPAHRAAPDVEELWWSPYKVAIEVCNCIPHGQSSEYTWDNREAAQVMFLQRIIKEFIEKEAAYIAARDASKNAPVMEGRATISHALMTRNVISNAQAARSSQLAYQTMNALRDLDVMRTSVVKDLQDLSSRALSTQQSETLKKCSWSCMGQMVYEMQSASVNEKDMAKKAHMVQKVHGAAEFKYPDAATFNKLDVIRVKEVRNTGFDQLLSAADPFYVKNAMPVVKDENNVVVDFGWRPKGHADETKLHAWQDLITDVEAKLNVLIASVFETGEVSDIFDLQDVDALFVVTEATKGRGDLRAVDVCQHLADVDDAIKKSVANLRMVLYEHSTATSEIKGDVKIPFSFSYFDDFPRREEDVKSAEAIKAMENKTKNDKTKKSTALNMRNKWVRLEALAEKTETTPKQWLQSSYPWRASVRTGGRVFHHTRFLPDGDQRHLTISKDDKNNPDFNVKSYPVSKKLQATINAIQAYNVGGLLENGMRLLVYNLVEEMDLCGERLRSDFQLSCQRRRNEFFPPFENKKPDPSYIWSWYSAAKTAPDRYDPQKEGQCPEISFIGPDGQERKFTLQDGNQISFTDLMKSETELEFTMPVAGDRPTIMVTGGKGAITCNLEQKPGKSGKSIFKLHGSIKRWTCHNEFAKVQAEPSKGKAVDEAAPAVPVNTRVHVYQEYGWPKDLDLLVNTWNPQNENELENIELDSKQNNIRAYMMQYIESVKKWIAAFGEGDEYDSPIAQLLSRLEYGGAGVLKPPLFKFRGDMVLNVDLRRPDDPLVHAPWFKEDDGLVVSSQSPLLKMQGAPIGQELYGDPPKQEWLDWVNVQYKTSTPPFDPETRNPILVPRSKDADFQPTDESGLLEWDKFDEQGRVQRYTQVVDVYEDLNFQVQMAIEERRRVRLQQDNSDRLRLEDCKFYIESLSERPQRKDGDVYRTTGILVKSPIMLPTERGPKQYPAKGKEDDPLLLGATTDALLEMLRQEKERLEPYIKHERFLRSLKTYYNTQYSDRYLSTWEPLRLKVVVVEGTPRLQHLHTRSKLAELQQRNVQDEAVQIDPTSAFKVRLRYDSDGQKREIKDVQKFLPAFTDAAYQELLAKHDNDQRAAVASFVQTQARSEANDNYNYIIQKARQSSLRERFESLQKDRIRIQAQTTASTRESDLVFFRNLLRIIGEIEYGRAGHQNIDGALRHVLYLGPPVGIKPEDLRSEDNPNDAYGNYPNERDADENLIDDPFLQAVAKAEFDRTKAFQSIAQELAGKPDLMGSRHASNHYSHARKGGRTRTTSAGRKDGLKMVENERARNARLNLALKQRARDDSLQLQNSDNSLVLVGGHTGRPQSRVSIERRYASAVQLAMKKVNATESDEEINQLYNDYQWIIKAFTNAVIKQRRLKFTFPHNTAYMFSSKVNEHVVRTARRVSRLLTGKGVSDAEQRYFPGLPGLEDEDSEAFWVLREARAEILSICRKANAFAVEPVAEVSDADREAQVREGTILGLRFKVDLRKVFLSPGSVPLSAESMDVGDGQRDPPYKQLLNVLNVYEALVVRARDSFNENRFGVNRDRDFRERSEDGYEKMLRQEESIVDFAIERSATRKRMLTDFIGELKDLIRADSLDVAAVRGYVAEFKAVCERSSFNERMIGAGYIQVLDIIVADTERAHNAILSHYGLLIACRQTFDVFVAWLNMALKTVFGENEHVRSFLDEEGELKEDVVARAVELDLRERLGLASEINPDKDLIETITEQYYGLKQQWQQGAGDKRSRNARDIPTYAKLQECLDLYRSLYFQPAIRGIDDDVFPFFRRHVEDCIKNANTAPLSGWEGEAELAGLRQPPVEDGLLKESPLLALETDEQIAQLEALIETKEVRGDSRSVLQLSDLLQKAKLSSYERASNAVGRQRAASEQQDRQRNPLPDTPRGDPSLPRVLALDMGRRDTTKSLGNPGVVRINADDGLGRFVAALRRKTAFSNWQKQLERKRNERQGLRSGQDTRDGNLGGEPDFVEERIASLDEQIKKLELNPPEGENERAALELKEVADREYKDLFERLQKFVVRTTRRPPGFDDPRYDPSTSVEAGEVSGTLDDDDGGGAGRAPMDVDVSPPPFLIVEELMRSPEWRRQFEMVSTRGSEDYEEGLVNVSAQRVLPDGALFLGGAQGRHGEYGESGIRALEDAALAPKALIYGIGGYDDPEAAEESQRNTRDWIDLWRTAEAPEQHQLLVELGIIEKKTPVIWPSESNDPATGLWPQDDKAAPDFPVKLLGQKGAKSAWLAMPANHRLAIAQMLNDDANALPDFAWRNSPRRWVGLPSDLVQTDESGAVALRLDALRLGGKAGKYFLPDKYQRDYVGGANLSDADGKIYFEINLQDEVTWHNLPSELTWTGYPDFEFTERPQVNPFLRPPFAPENAIAMRRRFDLDPPDLIWNVDKARWEETQRYKNIVNRQKFGDARPRPFLRNHSDRAMDRYEAFAAQLTPPLTTVAMLKSIARELQNHQVVFTTMFSNEVAAAQLERQRITFNRNFISAAEDGTYRVHVKSLWHTMMAWRRYAVPRDKGGEDDAVPTEWQEFFDSALLFLRASGYAYTIGLEPRNHEKLRARRLDINYPTIDPADVPEEWFGSEEGIPADSGWSKGVQYDDDDWRQEDRPVEREEIEGLFISND